MPPPDPNSRTLRNAPAIDSPAKRAKLKPRRNPYWRGVSGGRGGVSLGYRKTDHGPGSWIAKIVFEKKRFEERLGVADDPRADADALSFTQATTAALQWGREKMAAIDAASETDGSVSDPTVADAVHAYIQERIARAPRTGGDAKSRLTRHVLVDESLARTRLRKLTAGAIRAWLNRLTLGKDHAQLKTEKSRTRGRPSSNKLAATTINRTLNDLRAALNAAAELHRRALPGGIMAEIKVGTRALPDAIVARRQVLSDADVRKIVESAFRIDACGDLGRLVLLLASTGARFSQVADLTVADVQPEAGRIMIPRSKKGRQRKDRPKIGVPVGEDVLEALRPVLASRSASEPLLERWRHRQVEATRWERVSRGRWHMASELTRLWSNVLRDAGLDLEIIPYALRHTSIVRNLRANLPTRVVAALHDTSTEMIEKHYSAHVLDATEDLARRAITPLAPGRTGLRVA